MATVDELNLEAQQLAQRLQQIEDDKKAAAQQERYEQMALLERTENRAASYRSQAEKTGKADDKIALYEFADEADREALQLRLALGLLSEEQVNETTAQRQYEQQLRVSRKINGLFFKSLAGFVVYLIADYTSANLETGFLAFALRAIGQVSYCIAVIFGGCWLVCITLFGFVVEYGSNGLKRDFYGISPGVRLGILVALLAAILHFLSNALPNGN